MTEAVNASDCARMANVLELLRIVERSLDQAGADFPAYCTRLTISAVLDEMVASALSEEDGPTTDPGHVLPRRSNVA